MAASRRSRFRQGRGRGVNGVVLAMPLRDCPIQHGVNAMLNAACSLALGFPDRLENRQHVGGFDFAHGHLADGRQRVIAHARPPLPFRLGVPPRWALNLQNRLKRIGEGWRAARRELAAPKRVLAAAQRSAVLKGNLARFAQRNKRKAA